jgi:hypothetical protein
MASWRNHLLNNLSLKYYCKSGEENSVESTCCGASGKFLLDCRKFSIGERNSRADEIFLKMNRSGIIWGLEVNRSEDTEELIVAC